MSVDHGKTREGLLGIASLLFLGAYAYPIVHPSLSEIAWDVCDAIQIVVWAAFGLDYLVKFLTAPMKRSFLLSHWFDALVLIVPFLRPLRVLRTISIASLVARRFSQGDAFRTTVAIRAAVSAAVIWLVSGLAVTEAEVGHGGTIQDAWDGLWWSITTMTTVGYGDTFPVTIEGRVIGTGLMLTGIALLSVVTGTFASWIVEKTNEAVRLVQIEEAEINLLRQELQQIRSILEVQNSEQVPTQDQ